MLMLAVCVCTEQALLSCQGRAYFPEDGSLPSLSEVTPVTEALAFHGVLSENVRVGCIHLNQITECLGLEGASRDHCVKSLCQSRIT